MWYAKACVTIASILATASISLATTIHVPADQPTIQAGIDAAVNGDTVLIANGLYIENGNRDIDFLGKGILVVSENGPENCLIDCGGTESDKHRGFYFHTSEDSSSILQGITIRSGYSSTGGGIYCEDSSPKIIDNIIANNAVDSYGGGIACLWSSAILRGNTVILNTTIGPNGHGGGIFCEYPRDEALHPVIEDNIIQYNVANGMGGGIYCDATDPLITGNTVISNTAEWDGGAISVHWSNSVIERNEIIGNSAHGGGGIRCAFYYPTIADNIISANIAKNSNGGGILCSICDANIFRNNILNNVSEFSGGGIHCEYSSGNITENIIIGNTAYSGGGLNCFDASPMISKNIINENIAEGENSNGGGIACDHSNSLIINNTLSKNIATQYGGGINSWNSSLSIVKNTIAGNTAWSSYGAGGGLCLNHDSYLVVFNTILWNNDSPNGSEICLAYFDKPSTLTIGYSDVEDGQDSVYIEGGSTLNWGPGMINSNPMFVLSDQQDHRLLWDSPCIDSGHPDSLDADGTRSDMGAYFFNQNDYVTLYVTPDKRWGRQGGKFGATYTVINRWENPELFWGISRVYFPGGGFINIIGPKEYTVPANYTGQFHISRKIPGTVPTGICEFWSMLFMPPSTIYDKDSFKFLVIE